VCLQQARAPDLYLIQLVIQCLHHGKDLLLQAHILKRGFCAPHQAMSSNKLTLTIDGVWIHGLEAKDPQHLV